MSSDLSHHFLEGRPLAEDERRSLLQAARRYRDAAREGGPSPALSGRHIAIAGADGGSAERLLEEAARRLGARVSHIDQKALRRSDDGVALARVLGGLYDAIDCGSLPAERALELERLAGIPVFDGLAAPAHFIRSLLPELSDGRGEPPSTLVEEDLTSLVQAVLVEAMS